jgi:uncharacterized RDD family membrane protein YckC
MEPNTNPYAAPIEGTVLQPRSGLPLAARSTRFWAAMVDGLLLALVVMPFVALAAMAGENASGAAILLPLLAGVGFYAYQCHLIATSGQSLAKRWLNIRIIMLNGENPGFVHGIVLRQWVMALLGAIPFVSIIDALLIFGEERRCLHDLLAGTTVITSS